MKKSIYWLFVIYFICSNIWIWNVYFRFQRLEKMVHDTSTGFHDVVQTEVIQTRSVVNMKLGRHPKLPGGFILEDKTAVSDGQPETAAQPQGTVNDSAPVP